MANLQNHILYMEDHEGTRDLVTLILTASNYRVTTTGSIKHALKLTLEQRFDLYIIDSRLPDGSGIELCKQIREFDPRTPIMFHSAAAYETDKQAAMDSGAQRYLVKPADIQVLSNEVTSLIGFTHKHNHVAGLTRSPSALRAGKDDRAASLGVVDLESRVS